MFVLATPAPKTTVRPASVIRLVSGWVNRIVWFTFKCATVLVALPKEFVTMTKYGPADPNVTAPKASSAFVALVTFVLLKYHWYFSGVLPLAALLNVTEVPSNTSL